jgi:hypothetical protein
MIERGWAEAFAREWVEAWNAHDLDRILAHYDEEFTMTSPLIEQRMGIADGTLRGKAAVRAYWAQGLAAAPLLRFELAGVFVGVQSMGIVYKSAALGRTVVEYVEFDERRRVVRSEALWGVE